MQNTSILRTGLSSATTILSADYRPLGSCPRAAGWSAATLCVDPEQTSDPFFRAQVPTAAIRVSAGAIPSLAGRSEGSSDERARNRRSARSYLPQNNFRFAIGASRGSSATGRHLRGAARYCQFATRLAAHIRHHPRQRSTSMPSGFGDLPSCRGSRLSSRCA